MKTESTLLEIFAGKRRGTRIVETPAPTRASSVTQVYRPSKLPRIAAEHLVGLLQFKNANSPHRRLLRDRGRRPHFSDALALANVEEEDTHPWLFRPQLI